MQGLGEPSDARVRPPTSPHIAPEMRSHLSTARPEVEPPVPRHDLAPRPAGGPTDFVSAPGMSAAASARR